MATRNKLPIDLVWVLVDLNHPRAGDLTAVAEIRHKSRVSRAELSVNRSADGTQALIKIVSTETGFREALSAAERGAIVRVFTEADHDEALAIVRDPVWEPFEDIAALTP